MATVLTDSTSSALPLTWNVSDLLEHLDVPAQRIRLHPPPGTATVQDVVRIEAQEDRLFELIEGTLVEKAMGWYESLLAGWIVTRLNNYLAKNPIGKSLGPDGTLRLFLHMVRIPDVCFIGWDRFPPGGLPREAVPLLVPDLAVEVISRSNTTGEMQRKLADYFRAGVKLVWYIDAEARTATAYTSPSDAVAIPLGGTLDGGEVLPGFTLSLAELFAEADRTGPGT